MVTQIQTTRRSDIGVVYHNLVSIRQSHKKKSIKQSSHNIGITKVYRNVEVIGCYNFSHSGSNSILKFAETASDSRTRKVKYSMVKSKFVGSLRMTVSR